MEWYNVYQLLDRLDTSLIEEWRSTFIEQTMPTLMQTFTGFLQVRENWKSQGILCGQGKSGKGQGKIIFWKSQGKVRENDIPNFFRVIRSQI